MKASNRRIPRAKLRIPEKGLSTAAYIAEFDRLNWLKPLTYTFNLEPQPCLTSSPKSSKSR